MAYTPGKGTTITLAGTARAQVLNITPPSMEMGVTETTHLTSTWKTFIANIPDGGEVSLTIEYDASETTHAALWTDFQAGTAGTYTIVFTDTGAAVVGFAAIITKFAWDQIAVDGVVTASLTLKITGTVSITP